MMTSEAPSSRYTLLESDPHAQRASFAEAVAQGLGAEPKTLACRFLYDEVGSALFEEICRLPEYYLTRAEREILEARADEIVARAGECAQLVELGSGSASKTRLLIEALPAPPAAVCATSRSTSRAARSRRARRRCSATTRVSRSARSPASTSRGCGTCAATPRSRA